jgi:DNA-binding NarL/FixJ family response regulator
MDLKSLLNYEGFQIVGIARSAHRALDLLAIRDPNFVILDIRLGTGPSGIEVAEIIHEKHHIPYVFLTSFSDPDTLQAAQEKGPFGYIVKPFQDKTLITTITTAWYTFQRIHQQDTAGRIKKLEGLTDQERNICQLLLDGLSYKQICASCHISMNTLKFHVKNIYQKMDVASRAELSNRLA